MVQIEGSTLEFLKQLSSNNSKEWFDKHRNDYLAAKANFESFVQALLIEITGFDPIMKGLEAKSCIFRINRDIRFSHDKSPYKTNMGAFMVKGGKKNGDKYAGYYFHLEPGKSMLAGGAYLPPAQWLNSIREKIDEEPSTLLKTINSVEFKKYFGQLEGEKLQKAPKGFDPGHKNIELLKYKSFLAVHNITDKQVLGADYLKYSTGVFRAMKPLNEFLNEY